jgi:hypothetical protein
MIIKDVSRVGPTPFMSDRTSSKLIMYKLRYECGFNISGDGTVQTGPGSTPTIAKNVEIKYKVH